MVNMSSGLCPQPVPRPSLDPFTFQAALQQLHEILSSKSRKESWRPTCCSAESGTGKRCRRQQEDNPLLKFLALNALELTVPASDAAVRGSGWVQLSGHRDAFAPAGPGTVWKRCGGGAEEAAYRALSLEPALRGLTPAFLRQVHYRSNTFIELQDLLHTFTDPHVMDVKMGTRTFLEDEVQNLTARHDLYLKMVAVDPDAPTEAEHRAQAVTKLRYMMFREEQSSSSSLGFRIEAIKVRGSAPVTELKRVRSEEAVREVVGLFLGGRRGTRMRLLARLRDMRSRLQASPYLASHELIGASLLIVHDDHSANAWLIDFAKTRRVPEGIVLNHRSPWSPGNHEDGFLLGLDNFITVLEKLDVGKTERPMSGSKPVALKS